MITRATSGSPPRPGPRGGSCSPTRTSPPCSRTSASSCATAGSTPCRGRSCPGRSSGSRRCGRSAGRRPDDDAPLAGLSDDPSRREASTLGYLGYLDRLSALEAALRADGQWGFPHPWLTTFVGETAVESVVGGELARLDPPADLGPLGQAALNPIRRDAVRTPLLRMPPDPLVHAFNLIRLPAADDAGEARRLVAANRAAYERIRDAGGTLYPVSALPMSGADRRAHLGPAFERLEAAQRAFDPDDVITPGYEVF